MIYRFRLKLQEKKETVKSKSTLRQYVNVLNLHHDGRGNWGVKYLANLNCSLIMPLICVYTKVFLTNRTSEVNSLYDGNLHCTVMDGVDVLYVVYIHYRNCCTEFSIFIAQVINRKEQQLN